MIGEPAWRIIFVEIPPNLTPLIGINLVGSIIYAIVAQTTLEYLGFGDPLKVSGARCSIMPRMHRRSWSARGGTSACRPSASR